MNRRIEHNETGCPCRLPVIGAAPDVHDGRVAAVHDVVAVVSRRGHICIIGQDTQHASDRKRVEISGRAVARRTPRELSARSRSGATTRRRRFVWNCRATLLRRGSPCSRKRCRACFGLWPTRASSPSKIESSSSTACHDCARTTEVQRRIATSISR